VQKTVRTHRGPTTIPTQRSSHDAELLDDAHDFLDEIDDVLEENALEVTRRYRQRGGE